ncbi:MAG: flagellar hook-basal body complex protein FliE [Thermodesulfobacteriota bacterium]
MVSINQLASAAYGATQKMAGSPGPAEGVSAGGPASGTQDEGVTFSALVQEGLDQFIDTQKRAEGLSLDLVAGKADINDVIFATQEASVELETIVAIRDKVVQAYQSIIGMSI